MHRSPRLRSSGPQAWRARASARAAARDVRGLGAGRQPPVGRIDDQRGPVVPVALDHPEVVVVAGRAVARRERLGLGQGRREHAVAEGGVARLVVEQLAGARLQGRHLLVGEGLAVAEHLGPLQRRHVVVGPDPLQVGVAVGGPGRRPLLPRRHRRRREHRHDENQRFQSHGILLFPNANAARRPSAMTLVSARIPPHASRFTRFRAPPPRRPAQARRLRGATVRAVQRPPAVTAGPWSSPYPVRQQPRPHGRRSARR